jgi:hypothetical protein
LILPEKGDLWNNVFHIGKGKENPRAAQLAAERDGICRSG